MIKIITDALLIFFLCSSSSYAANIYVDGTLGADCSGNYSIASRNCSGSDGDAYDTIQEAVTAVTAGDTIHMRGGTYAEHINIPDNKQGSAESRITLRSYSGEWAVLDPNHDDGSGYDAYVIRYKDGSYSVCPSYWTFSNFEVTGGGINNSGDGGGILLDTAHHIIFEYLYVHDNYGGGINNSGGISVPNDGQAPQYIIVRYNWMEDNASTTNDNCGHILLFSDYVDDPTSVNISNANHHNEVYYNYLVGSRVGIRDKNSQWLSLSHAGTHTTYEDYGNKYHHNYILDNTGHPVNVRNDFAQVYNNIMESDSADELYIGERSSSDREPFYVCFYNNTIIRAKVSLYHDGTGSSSYTISGVDSAHPHFYMYNNTIDSAGVGDGRNELNILFTWSGWVESEIDMDTVHVENNLIYPKATTNAVINLGDNANDLSVSDYITAGYSTTFYANSTAGLYTSDYICDPTFVLSGVTTIADGGIGGNHPYLSGITIPSYVGAVNPDDDSWVAGVIGLSDLTGSVPTNLRDGSGDPAWIEGSDAITATITASDITASEVGPATGSFTVVCADCVSGETVDYTLSGTATDTTDYNDDGDGTIEFSGSTPVVVTITPIADSACEGEESVSVTLTNPTGCALGGTTSTIIYITDDSAGDCSFVPSSTGRVYNSKGGGRTVNSSGSGETFNDNN